MRKFKIVIIGGASMTWVPKFIKDVLLVEGADGSEIALVDIDGEKLEVMGSLIERMIKERDKDFRVCLYNDRRTAMKGADIVIITCMIGGHEHWCDDLNIILKYGIEHPKGMSVGPGGLIQGLKNIPEIVGFAREMEEICPDAWIMNFTNPMQSITLGLSQYSKVKSVGLCHGIPEGIKELSKFLGIPARELNYRAFGINHCGWLFELKQGSRNLLPELRKRLDEVAPSLKSRWEGQEIVTREMWDIFGAYPLQADIHTIEFFPHYIHKGTKLEAYSLEHNFVEKRIENKAKLWDKITKAANSEIPTSQAIGNTANSNDITYASEERVEELIYSVIDNRPTNLYVNIMNQGCISSLPDDCCVEVLGVVDASGVYGCAMGALPDGIAALTALHAYIQKLTVKAAMEGSRELALQALCLEPMCNGLKLSEIKSMLNELLDSQPKWLPNFFK